ncbi:MAG: MBL fold metallo-hydrolase [Oscillospiraceae bacterium]|nr:MBL fold metallo-hydrolase [Oscillospiraceae bacterium]
MEIIYIGTAASEGIPALFCKCPTCVEARKTMGREFRGRAGVCINKNLLIDAPPDIYHGCVAAGIDLSEIKDIVVTHAHEDHFDAYELSTRRTPVYCFRPDEEKMRVWGNMRCGKLLDQYVPGSAKGHGDSTPGLCFTYSPMYEPVKTASGVTAYPLPADHDYEEECRIFLLEEDATGKRFLYGHDTGLFPDETMKFLKGKLCDVISLDCTYVYLKHDSGHMGLEGDVKMRKRLTEIGAANDKTRFICHHFSHNGFVDNGARKTQTEFISDAEKMGFIVAFDGMRIKI